MNRRTKTLSHQQEGSRQSRSRDRDVWWDPAEDRTDGGRGIWRGEIGLDFEEDVMMDLLLRVLSRVTAFESAAETHMQVRGKTVSVDAHEEDLLTLLNRNSTWAEDIRP